MLVAGAPTANGQVVSLEYEGLMRQYARGDRAAAIEGLARMRASDLDLQVHALQRQAKAAAAVLDALPLRAAVMLHVDRDRLEQPVAPGREQARPCPGDHARRAGQIAALLVHRDQTRDFARDFFLAMTQRCQWDYCLDPAERWGRDGLERFPGDPSLLLAVGAVLEERATVGHAATASERVVRFREAARLLSEAIAADPVRLEARVRLGRVQWRLGEDESARATLEAALRQDGEAPWLYLAHLFLGQVHERAGRLDEAAREFVAAREIDPQSQAAAVALSHVRLLAGDTKEARELLTGTLALAGRRDRRDLYWDYVASGSPEALFDALRREARE
jgi:tetratricopeptide (TPR) repeat protein